MELQLWAVGGRPWMVVFGMAFVSCNAFLDLSGVHEIKGTWMASTSLPCTYMPSEGFTQQTLTWSIERDHSTSTIFRRDETGDHILLSQFRDRVSVPKHSPGNISLLIKNLEIPDSGHYTCQVVWRSINNSLITKEVTTMVKVVKVAVTKPIIRPGELGLVVPAGARTSLTCVASGSPPIRYRWFRGSPGGTAQPLGSQAELAWARLLPSDAGTYFCQAENRVGAAQHSDTVQLLVTGLPAAPTVSGGDAAPEGPPTAAGAPRAAPSLLLAALGAAAGALLVALLLRRWKKRKRRGRDGDEPLYEVAFHSTDTRLEGDVEVPVKSLHQETKPETPNDTSTVKDRPSSVCSQKSPEYENLVNAMELEYDIETM